MTKDLHQTNVTRRGLSGKRPSPADADGDAVGQMDLISQRSNAVDASEGTLEGLRDQLRGPALTPSDPGYSDARVPFNAMHRDRPSLVVRCLDVADVVAAVDFARDACIEVTVRGGGHSIAGLSSSYGGMVIDLSLMNAVEVDPDLGVVHVEGGALLGDVDHETQAFGLATPLGAVSETGVGGLALGGGYGWLRRKYGLTCDNLISAQVVCADGRVRAASERINPDLFWALRGGGGGFGIVISFTFRLHPVGPVVAFAGAFYPLADAESVLRSFREWLPTAPDDVTPEAIVFASAMPASDDLPESLHGEKVVVIAGVHAGAADEGATALQPLREFGTPLADISQPMPFTSVQTVFDGFFPRGQLQSYWKSTYLDELPDAAIDAMVRRAHERRVVPSEFELAYFAIFPMGGAVNRVDPAAMAFSERAASYLVSVDSNWTDPADNADQVRWVREAWNTVAAFGRSSTYLNFSGRWDEPAEAGIDAFGDNLRRLGEVKATYDPGNVFRPSNNIVPA